MWQGGEYRIVIADDTPAPVLRVIWNAHVREMSDLDVTEQLGLMRAVFAAEAELRALLAPDKINLASLGNQVAHVHWHVVARFTDDSWFPDSIWSGLRRPGRRRAVEPAAIQAALTQRLGAGRGAG